MNMTEKLTQAVVAGIAALYEKDVEPESVNIQETRKDFEGDLTIVCFPFAKLGVGAPPVIGEQLGNYLKGELPEVEDYNVIKGFLNLRFSDEYWLSQISGTNIETLTKTKVGTGKRVVVEFSSPNTNKPLHLGHLRNNFLGDSVCRILEANGYDVFRVCLYNDRGIAITKSMVSYTIFGAGETPESAGIKGDFLVVKYYVQFGTEHKRQVAELVAGGMSEKEASEAAPLMQAAREMLRKWEAGDPETVALWEKMNAWVYEGFEATYRRIGIRFDKNYYESQTYLLGNEIVDQGLAANVFEKEDDGSVWIDLTEDGLDRKLVRRKDGTSVYITQDIGTAEARYQEFGMDEHIYVVADEQNYHFKVLFLIMEKLGRPWAKGMHHLAYGMVDLPSGRMKTREGTSVDADDLMDEVVKAAEERVKESGKTEGMSEAELAELYEKLGIAALKYFILKVGPKKRMIYNPEESVSLEGDSGPFVQYSYARVSGVARRAQEMTGNPEAYVKLEPQERELIKTILLYPGQLELAAINRDPSIVAGYLNELAKSFNRFYHHVPILKADSEDATAFRFKLSGIAAVVIRSGMDLLGIQVPDRM